MQMLNEPLGGEAEAAEAQGTPHTNYIQVTQQEKEAIERVRVLSQTCTAFCCSQYIKNVV